MSEAQSIDRNARCQLYAVLVRVFETGVLLVGESGIGKSECALELITKGHQLVADDAVEVIIRDGKPVGRAPEITRRLIEIRGLGIMDASEIFGDSAVCDESVIDLCIELRERAESERLNDPFTEHQLAGVTIPKLVLPVTPGRNLGILIESAVRLQKKGGANSVAKSLIEKHAKLLDQLQ